MATTSEVTRYIEQTSAATAASANAVASIVIACPAGRRWNITQLSVETSTGVTNEVDVWVRSDRGVTLAEALDASETGVDVSDVTQFKVGDMLLVDTELMLITAIATPTLTVTRGVEGTTGATHSDAAATQAEMRQWPNLVNVPATELFLDFLTRLNTAVLMEAGDSLVVRVETTAAAAITVTVHASVTERDL